MASVKLTVNVVRDQIDRLQQDIDKLNNTKIQIKVDNGGLTRLEKKVDSAAGKVKNLDEAQKNLNESIKQGNDAFSTETRNIQENTNELKKGTTARKNYTKGAQDGSKATKEMTEEAGKQKRIIDSLGQSFSDFTKRLLAYHTVHMAIRAVTNGIKESLQTMKAVDDELVTVRKVTGFDQYQMAGVEQSAYDVATKYGANAADYVSGVAEFARAGYRELSSQLAELAQKTQIVGDTTADVANQFLLSVDAAYKYNGSVTALTKVLDGANEIDNKYATSIAKIAEGMGIVAPVAAQMHVGVDELAASIGTITAVTQRSGTETARALRALFLNIVGDTKTEIDEGVTWTTGEIAGLRDIIKNYAKDAYDAAQATGSIIDPMKAMEGLSKSLKDGVLTEQQLMEMVSDIGGKLRTSQLLALINNWDMYESMLNDYRNAAGSADKEIENAMDSWTRKTNVLKNTWTQFVKTGMNSDWIKGALDFITTLVEHLDSIPGVLMRITMLVAAIRLPNIASSIRSIVDGLAGMSGLMKGLSGALVVVAGAWALISAAIEEDRIAHEKYVQSVYEAGEAAQSSSQNLVDLYKEVYLSKEGTDEFAQSVNALADALGRTLPEGAQNAISALNGMTSAQLLANAGAANTAKIVAGDEFVGASEGSATQGILSNDPEDWGLPQAQELVRSLQDIYYYLPEIEDGGFIDITTAENAEKFRQAMETAATAFDLYVKETGDRSVLDSKYYEYLQAYLGSTAEAFQALKEKKDAALETEALYRFQDGLSKTSVSSEHDFNTLISGFISSKEYGYGVKKLLIEMAYDLYPQYRKAIEDTTQTQGRERTALDAVTAALNKNISALDESATAEERAKAAKADAEAAARALIPVLFDETGKLTDVGKAAFTADENLAGYVKSELDAQYAAASANYSNLIAQIALVGEMAALTTQQLANMALAAGLNINDPADLAQLRGMAETAHYKGTSTQLELANYAKTNLNAIQNAIGQVGSYAGGSSSSGGGHSGGSGRTSPSASKQEDERRTALENRIKLLKSELSLMQERGDGEEDQIAKIKEIQAALHEEADYLRSIGEDQTTINGLSQEWWSLQNKIASIQETIAKDAEATADAIQKAVDAQLALNSAMDERTTRYYNAETGQWEWGANRETVANAKSAFDEAFAAVPEDQKGAYYAALSAAMIADPSSWRPTLGHGLSSAYSYNDSILPKTNSNSYVGATNNYGSTYQIGNISLSEAQAKELTLYELVQISKNLGLYSGR